MLEGLKADITRAGLERLAEDPVNETNDRGGVGICLGVRPATYSAAEGELLADFTQLLKNLLHAGGVAAVVFLDPVFDLVGLGDHHMEVLAQRKAQIFRRPKVEWIDQGY